MGNKLALHCESGKLEHNHTTLDAVKECNRIHQEKEYHKDKITILQKDLEKKTLELEIEKMKLKDEKRKMESLKEDEKEKREVLEKECARLKDTIAELEIVIQIGGRYFTEQLQITENRGESHAWMMKTCQMTVVKA